ncbi:hypothetical protein D8T88_17970 [Salmonella enterica]|nr:hypothetical protein [Salmonella enterica]
MLVSMITSFLIFFVVFFRLSLFYPYFYFALIPAVFGFFVFIKNINNKSSVIIRNQSQLFVFIMLVMITIFCFAYDLFQKSIDVQSSFFIRMSMLVVLSILPAYFLVYNLKGDESRLKKIIILSIWIQIVLFLLMYFSDGAKHTLYSIFGMGDSVNLLDQNDRVRGFGLSTEINYMSPFLMIFLCFFILQNKYFLLLMTCLTQIVNSNMAVLAIVTALVFSKIKLSTKIIAIIFLSIIVFSIGSILFPRFYDEFINSGGTRTLEILIQQHVFTIGTIDWFTSFFGFQQNISSSIPDLSVSSDMGWVIMFNYGGGLFILQFILLLVALSIAAFGHTKLAFVWFLVGILFNTKGLALGPNGYMFITFIYIFMRCYRAYEEKFLFKNIY